MSKKNKSDVVENAVENAVENVVVADVVEVPETVIAASLEGEIGSVDEPVAEPALGFRKLTAEEIAAGSKKERVVNDNDDIAAVLELRALGLSYMKIEEKLGWKDSHGNRSWRICKTYALVPKTTVQ